MIRNKYDVVTVKLFDQTEVATHVFSITFCFIYYFLKRGGGVGVVGGGVGGGWGWVLK